MQVVTELKNCGVQDIFIACVDGLKGFPEAIEAVFPKSRCNSAWCISYETRFLTSQTRTGRP
jgi:putative transposase